MRRRLSQRQMCIRDSVWAEAREPWPSADGRLLDSLLTNAWSDGVDEVFGTHRERTGAFNASE